MVVCFLFPGEEEGDLVLMVVLVIHQKVDWAVVLFLTLMVAVEVAVNCQMATACLPLEVELVGQNLVLSLVEWGEALNYC